MQQMTETQHPAPPGAEQLRREIELGKPRVRSRLLHAIEAWNRVAVPAAPPREPCGWPAERAGPRP